MCFLFSDLGYRGRSFLSKIVFLAGAGVLRLCHNSNLLLYEIF